MADGHDLDRRGARRGGFAAAYSTVTAVALLVVAVTGCSQHSRGSEAPAPVATYVVPAESLAASAEAVTPESEGSAAAEPATRDEPPEPQAELPSVDNNSVSPSPSPVPPRDAAASPPFELAAPMADSRPVRLRIPAIGVNSTLMRLGLRADRTLEVPPRAFPAGWYTGSPTPGELGPAIIAGHVDMSGQRGVFYDLRRLARGDTVAVDRQDGTTATFRVSRVQRFAKDAFPTSLVYGDIGWSGLRLITCGGAFDRKARSYVDNIVVFADLVGSS